MSRSVLVTTLRRWRSRWKRWVFSLFLLALPVLGFPIGKEYYARWQARQELAEVIAEIDRLDPRWRLEDIEADRRQVPPEHNAALVALAARRLMPRDWQSPVWDELEKVAPQHALRPELVKKLAAELHTLGPALQQARQLKDCPLGRHKIAYTDDFVSTLVADQQEIRAVARLLELDIAHLVHQGQTASALQSHRALLNAGRSMGDEPILISRLIRMAIDLRAVHQLEWILAQAEVDRPALSEVQQVLQDESDTPLFLVGLRGDRAGWQRFMSNIETGKFSLWQALSMGRPHESHWLDPFNEFLSFSMVLRSHAAILRFETRAIEAAKLPPGIRYRAFREIDGTFKTAFPMEDRSLALGRLAMPAFFKVAEAEQRAHSSLGCAVAGLAVEQFRLQQRRWPESLDEVVKSGFLKAVPLDLFDGHALRFRRVRDGVVVYSISRTGQYDGSARDHRPLDGLVPAAPGEPEPIEFRGWDVAQRRMLPWTAAGAESAAVRVLASRVGSFGPILALVR